MNQQTNITNKKMRMKNEKRNKQKTGERQKKNAQIKLRNEIMLFDQQNCVYKNYYYYYYHYYYYYYEKKQTKLIN